MKRCNYCFEEYGKEFEVCPYCGYVEGEAAKELYHLYPGTILKGRYIVGKVLGFGGFGITYMVWDTNLKTVLAIKEYYPSGLVNRVPGTRDVMLFTGNRLKEYNHGLMRFLDEARNMAKFGSHKNIVNVFEYFEENNSAYIVMECLHGVTLSEFLKSNRMDVESCIDVISHICTALKDIHKIGIIHRDISPDNIFLCTKGHTKLIDFGAARFSSKEEQQRTIILKPGFAPPEQYEKVNIQGPWTDIYALGATFYYMVTGIKPDESTNRRIEDELLAPHEVDENIPEYISNTIMQAIAIDKHMRFNSISDFEKGLNQKKKVLPVAKQIKRRKRSRRLGLSAAVLVVFLSAGLFYMNWFQRRLEEFLPDATIALAIPLTGDSGIDRVKEDSIRMITDSFRMSFPNIDFEFEFHPIKEYENKILEAMLRGEAPTLFYSTEFSRETLESATDLNRVWRRIEHGQTLFLENYADYLRNRKQVPLGFNAPVIYINTGLLDFEASGVSNIDDFLISTNTADVPFVVNDSDVDIFVHSFGENVLHELGENNREFFFRGESGAYFSNTSAFFEIQSSLPARYRLVYVDVERPLARFSHMWSMSESSRSERIVAERFLEYMLSENAQDLLHLRNRSGALPINRYVLELFSEVHDDFSGFFHNIEKYRFRLDD